MGGPALAVVILAAFSHVAPVPAEPIAPEARDAARRVVATVHLAAQEYAQAWEGGVLTRREEADEARLFIGEAQRAARLLPEGLAGAASRELAVIAQLLVAAAPADSVAARAAALEQRIRAAIGAALDDRPARAPSLAAGGRVYAARCAQCHGASGRGDGPAGAGLTPRPADLTARSDPASSSAHA